MRTSISRLVIIMASAVVLGVACSEAGQSPQPSFTVEPPGPYSFTVSGASYGPEEQEYIPPNCSRGGELRRTLKIYVRQSGDTVRIPVIKFGTWGTDGTACRLEVDNGGSPYNGGTVLVDATIEGTVQGLGNVPGDFTQMDQTFDVPTDATITLRVIVNEGYRFLHWTITRASGPPAYRAYETTLVRTAASGDVEFFAEFQQTTRPPSPPPPPPPPSDCDDPNVPGCDPPEPPGR